MTNHDHEYWHDDCMLCQDEKQDYMARRLEKIEFKRKAKILSIMEDDLIEILNDVDFGLPEGCVITGIYNSPINSSIEIKICDESFPVISLNSVIPHFVRDWTMFSECPKKIKKGLDNEYIK